jgi:hypothetical protein
MRMAERRVEGHFFAVDEMLGSVKRLFFFVPWGEG